MIRKKKGAIEWLEFELFAPYPEIQAAVFLRHGGVSKDSYHSLDIGSKDGDDDCIEENRHRIAEVLGLNGFRTCYQPHQGNVAFLPDATQEYLLTCDGMITNRPEDALLIKHADCQAAVFYDPITKTLAAVHAGWRSQVKNIYRETIEKFKTTTGTKPENLLVAVSPSLGPDHSEFIHFRKEWPEEYWRFQVKPTYFDLWAIGKHQLIEAGVKPKNIQYAEVCTYCHPDDFFSYRRQKPTGGHATVAFLKRL